MESVAGFPQFRLDVSLARSDQLICLARQARQLANPTMGCLKPSQLPTDLFSLGRVTSKILHALSLLKSESQLETHTPRPPAFLTDKSLPFERVQLGG